MPGTIIKQFRELRNYSQDYVSRKMGISQKAYSKIENNITQLCEIYKKVTQMQINKVLQTIAPNYKEFNN